MNIRREFEEQLSDLQSDLMRLGRFVQDAHGKAMNSLLNSDQALAKQIIGDDDIADDMTFGIQARATQLLALQQPVARDLRFIAATLNIVVDLERVGDHATDIAKMTRTLAGQSFFRPAADLEQLSLMARNMIGDALQTFVQHNAALAIQVARDDDAVDDLCDEIQRAMMDTMREDPSRVEQATRMLLVARALERVADHATNIAEQVYYVETGEKRHLAREEHNHQLLAALGVQEDEWKRQTGVAHRHDTEPEADSAASGPDAHGQEKENPPRSAPN